MLPTNCTPHPITLRTVAGDVVLPPADVALRVSMVETVVSAMDLGCFDQHSGCWMPAPVSGYEDDAVIPVIVRRPGVVLGLPRDEAGRIRPCIVSSMVLAALPPGTDNVYAPDTGPSAVRDIHGQVVAVTRLVRA